jgi:hypothetical protein
MLSVREEMVKKNEAERENSDLESGRVLPIGVGLREGEVSYLDKIALEHGISRNALIHYAIRVFLIDYRNGKIDISSNVEVPKSPKNKLNLPE